MSQNLRGLPMHVRDAKLSTVVLDDTYDYDENGNVAVITDDARADLTTRGMGYDALDRLTAVVSPGQWGNATYSYDAIDNLRTANQGTRQFTYTYDASNRLASISGSQSMAFGYNENGNITSKGTQDFTFDSANRMTSAEVLSGIGVQTYLYDGAGRRTQTIDPAGTPAATSYWVYSQSGQVLHTSEARRSRNLDYIYLGNSQVAVRAQAWATEGDSGQVTINYEHTDALGSIVAETNATGGVVTRNGYAPYGEAYGSTIDGTGYTGQVMDRDTGLTYMQQRYYDSQLGRFFSIDPASVEAAGDNFSRYWYAKDNPYLFTDPDGRNPTWSPQMLMGRLDAGFRETMDSAQDAAQRMAPRVLEGAMGVTDMVIGAMGVGGGAVLAGAGGVPSGGTAIVPGLALMASGALTFGDGAASFQNAIDGGDRHTVLGELVKRAGGNPLYGDMASATHGVNGARKAVVEAAEHMTVRATAQAVAETASAAKAVNDTTKKKERESEGGGL